MAPKQQAKGGKATGKNAGKQTGKKQDLMKKPKKSGGKVQKKSWSKTKVKEKLNNSVYFDADTMKKALKEVPAMKVITPATVSDRLKITASLAKVFLKDLEAKGQIVPVKVDNHIWIYTRAAKAAAAAETQTDAKKAPAKGKKQAKA